MSRNGESRHGERGAARGRRRAARFVSNALFYAVIVALLTVINVLATPGRWWVIWPALGLAFALFVVAWRVFVTPRVVALMDSSDAGANHSRGIRPQGGRHV
jgi:membrane protein YdbS with pleckstrin-like domain